MKNKTKVVLGLAAMLAGTAGIAGVSTYAWFTTQSTVKVSYNNATVRGDSVHISVSFDKTNQPTGMTFTDANLPSAKQSSSQVAIEGMSTAIVDLSGDGKTFYRPVNYKKDGYTSGTAKYDAENVETKSNKSTVTYFLSFNVLIENNSDQNTDVYLDPASLVEAYDPDGAGTEVATDSSKNAAKYTRVAIWENSGLTDKNISDTAVARTLWDPNQAAAGMILLPTADSHNTVADSIAFGKDYGYKNHTLTDGGVVKDGDQNAAQYYHYGDAVLPATFTDATRVDGKGSFICSLPTRTSKKSINISMWIEGTYVGADDTCINGIVDAQLAFIGKVNGTAN
jgi:hypothetical protein